EREADSFHQMRDENFRRGFPVDRRAIHGVAARRIAAIGPVEDAIHQIELEVDGLRQSVEKQLDVGAVRWPLALRYVEVRAADATESSVVRAFLRPVDLPEFWVDGDPDAPSHLIAHVVVAAAGLDQRFDVRTVEVRAHHAHALAVAPIELAAVLVEMDLL